MNSKENEYNTYSIKLGTIIQILDGSDWHGLYGVVDGYVGDIPVLFCISKPCDKYYLHPELMDRVRVVE